MFPLEMRGAAFVLDYVNFAVFVNREGLQELWEGSDFSVVPSVWEVPFGMVVIEAWSQVRAVLDHGIVAVRRIAWTCLALVLVFVVARVAGVALSEIHWGTPSEAGQRR